MQIDISLKVHLSIFVLDSRPQLQDVLVGLALLSLEGSIDGAVVQIVDLVLDHLVLLEVLLPALVSVPYLVLVRCDQPVILNVSRGSRERRILYSITLARLQREQLVLFYHLFGDFLKVLVMQSDLSVLALRSSE